MLELFELFVCHAELVEAQTKASFSSRKMDYKKAQAIRYTLRQAQWDN
jgi:hypothetical protein